MRRITMIAGWIVLGALSVQAHMLLAASRADYLTEAELA